MDTQAAGKVVAPVMAFGQLKEVPPFRLRRFDLVWLVSGLGPGPLGASADAAYARWAAGDVAQRSRDFLAAQ